MTMLFLDTLSFQSFLCGSPVQKITHQRVPDFQIGQPLGEHLTPITTSFKSNTNSPTQLQAHHLHP